MIRFTGKTVFFVFAFVLLTFTSCFTTRASIKEVKSNEDTFKQKSVIVKGVVTDEQKLPFREDGLYRIFDDDGESLWIYSDKIPLPERGSRIQVKGKLRKKDDIRKKLIGPVLLEEERK